MLQINFDGCIIVQVKKFDEFDFDLIGELFNLMLNRRCNAS